MPIKQGELYELPEGKEEIDVLAKKFGVKIDEYYNHVGEPETEFHSKQITVNGKISDYDNEKNGYTESDLKEVGEEIEGLSCPDCGSQAFKTDQKNVAVCGGYPGWYFFYRRTDLDKSSQSKIKIKIVNGKAVYVDESGTEVNKLE